MRILFCGDVVGRSGRSALYEQLPALRRGLALDFVIANGENAAGGFGITPAICAEFYKAGVDVITLGNHAWDQRELYTAIDGDARVLRALNFPPGTPGRGAMVYDAPGRRRVLVAQVMGRLFMDPFMDDPFRAVEAVVERYPLGGSVQAAVVDVHAEATAEKMAFGHMLDGRVSLVVGTHTHVPTADAHILPGGTAYQSDVGMTGDYDSVIGMEKRLSLERFRRKVPGLRLTPAIGEATLCAVYVETDDATGRALRVAPVQLGGRLPRLWPEDAAAAGEA
jgi:2',3'-cyclic-nucleotide 2'-phosphodiesterase